MEEVASLTVCSESWVAGGNEGIKRRQQNTRAGNRKAEMIESR